MTSSTVSVGGLTTSSLAFGISLTWEDAPLALAMSLAWEATLSASSISLAESPLSYLSPNSTSCSANWVWLLGYEDIRIEGHEHTPLHCFCFSSALSQQNLTCEFVILHNKSVRM